MSIALRTLLLTSAAASARGVMRIELSRAAKEPEFAKQLAPNASVAPLHEHFWYPFVAWASVGTPGQRVQLWPDIGGSETWVPGVPDPIGDSSLDSMQKYYMPGHSSTYRLVAGLWSLDYVGEGLWARDVVSLGAVQLGELEFGVATNLSYFHQSSGEIGFGLSSNEGAPILLQTLVKAEKIPAPVCALYVGETGGELSLGGPAEDRYEGSFHFVSLANRSYWSVDIDGVKFGNDTRWTAAGHTRFNWGVDLISAPSDLIAPYLQMWEAAGATAGGWLLRAPCGTQGPALHLKIDGRRYTLGPEDVLIAGDGPECEVAVRAYDGGPGGVYWSDGTVWSLGYPFLRKYYTQFDAAGGKRIGFALAKRPTDSFV